MRTKEQAERALQYAKEQLEKELDPLMRKNFEIMKRSLEAIGNPLRVFDWDKAAQLIKDFGTKEASAGLLDDWNWTADAIFTDGVPNMQCKCFLASTWALPMLEIDCERIECWRMESETPGWHAHTVWPESALRILEET